MLTDEAMDLRSLKIGPPGAPPVATRVSEFTIGLIAPTQRGTAPMNLYVVPSTFSHPVSGCSLPVQCFVGDPVSSFEADHTEKYGSCVISGTAGGLSVGRSAAGRAEVMSRANEIRRI